MPQEERSVEYYTNEYRFTAGDIVQVYTYKYNSDDLYRLTWDKSVTLVMGATSVTTALTATVLSAAAFLSF